MHWKKKLQFLVIAIQATLCASETQETGLNKHQICYLMQAQEVVQSIQMYQKYHESLGKHDFEILQQMALVLLQEGARNKDPEKQLLSIYGSALANVSSSIEVLETGISSSHLETQLAAIQFLGKMQDDRCDALLIKTMSSPFFQARMEAAYQLAVRKHHKAIGHIESLMYRVPPPYRFFFPQFFALIGTSESMHILRGLIEDRQDSVRVEAILSAARYGRDDLLNVIRAAATHLNPAEQEAASFALGLFKDSKSLDKLKRLSQSPSSHVFLSALRSLDQLGDKSAKEKIIERAKELDLYAISLLGEIEGSENVLASLTMHPDLQIRCNAVIALLKHRDPRCINGLLEILVRDTRDLGFYPQMSPGKTLFTWKCIASLQQHSQELYDFNSITLQLRQQILSQALELPEKDFLSLANALFQSRQTELITSLIALLENLQTPESIALLEKNAETAGIPLTRLYCTLSLFRLQKKEGHKQILKDWILRNQQNDLIRFRPMLPIGQRLADTPFELTPEDHSRLLIETCETLADQHEEKNIDFLLELIKKANSKNRYVLAGLLIRSIQ